MIAVRYLILAVVSFGVTALVLAIIYLPVVLLAAFALSRSLHPSYLQMYSSVAAMSVLPGLVVFSLVAPALLLSPIRDRVWWRLVAPLCLFASFVYWSVSVRLVPAGIPGPSAGMGEAIFAIVSLVAVLAAVLLGPLLVRWITALGARLFRT